MQILVTIISDTSNSVKEFTNLEAARDYFIKLTLKEEVEESAPTGDDEVESITLEKKPTKGFKLFKKK